MQNFLSKMKIYSIFILFSTSAYRLIYYIISVVHIIFAFYKIIKINITQGLINFINSMHVASITLKIPSLIFIKQKGKFSMVKM